MTGYKAYSIANQLFGQSHTACLRVLCSRLYLDPLTDKWLYVMPPNDICFQDLTCTRVDNRWTHGIGFGRCGISQHRVAHVITHLRQAIGIIKHLNGILKTSPLKCLIPICHTFFNIWTQVFGYGLVDIKHDGLNWFYQFATQIGGSIRWNETPTSDIVFGFYLVLIVVVLDVWGGEISHTGILLTTLHGIFWQERERRTHHYRHVYLAISLMNGRC